MRFVIGALLCLVLCSISHSAEDHGAPAARKEAAKDAQSKDKEAPAPSWIEEIVRDLEPELSGPVSESLRRQGITPTPTLIRQAIAALVAAKLQDKVTETTDLVKAKNKALADELNPMIRGILAAKLQGFPTIDGKLPDAEVAKLKASLATAQAKVFGKDTAKALTQATETFSADGKQTPLHRSLARFLLGANGSDRAASILLGALQVGPAGPAPVAPEPKKQVPPVAPVVPPERKAPDPAPVAPPDLDFENPAVKAMVKNAPDLLQLYGAAKLAQTPDEQKAFIARVVGMNMANLSTDQGKAAFDQYVRDLRAMAKRNGVDEYNVTRIVRATFVKDVEKAKRAGTLLPLVSESDRALLKGMMKGEGIEGLATTEAELEALRDNLFRLIRVDVSTPEGLIAFRLAATAIFDAGRARRIGSDRIRRMLTTDVIGRAMQGRKAEILGEIAARP